MQAQHSCRFHKPGLDQKLRCRRWWFATSVWKTTTAKGWCVQQRWPSHLATRSDADRCCQQSVISAVGLLVEDTVFRDTNGTAPEAGVE